MALSDLLNELKKDTFKMDNDSEKKICTAMVQLFDDPSGDVQGMAVKWYVLRRDALIDHSLFHLFIEPFSLIIYLLIAALSPSSRRSRRPSCRSSSTR